MAIARSLPVTVRTLADIVSDRPLPMPEVIVPMREAKLIEGELCFVFNKEEINRTATPFRFSVVLSFQRHRLSLDVIRGYIKNRWGLISMPVVGAMRRACNVLVRLTNEADFVTAMSREIMDIASVPYKIFHWTPTFNEYEESVLAPVWIFLPGLQPHFFHESTLKIFAGSYGRYLRTDNATACVSRPEGARMCGEMDVSKDHRSYFWIGPPNKTRSHFQEVVFETLPAYCSTCRIQGHSKTTCRREKLNAGKQKKRVSQSKADLKRFERSK
ncbi:hypothetical protein F2P56_013032 [Juglans regia]|uniref:DUF4283 domain-containing protein n=2 Tax=Juglans regia TaxID=51240 RepID=A0A834CRM3_JUGRE|nr:uncharacterized protein LOC109012140 [Juglans regia]KAF5468924.1 hypothetical protein F2P56_013032 [Juglans regia]